MKASSELPVAAESLILVDSLPTSDWAVPWRALRSSCLFIGGLIGFIAVVGLVRGQRWQVVMEEFPAVLVLGSIVTLELTLAAAIGPEMLRLRTMVWNGQFLVRFGDRIVATPLARCSWKVGPIQQMDGWKFRSFLRGQVLLVDLPAETKGRLRRVPVGFTDESRRLWRAFFELADLPRATT